MQIQLLQQSSLGFARKFMKFQDWRVMCRRDGRVSYLLSQGLMAGREKLATALRAPSITGFGRSKRGWYAHKLVHNIHSTSRLWHVTGWEKLDGYTVAYEMRARHHGAAKGWIGLIFIRCLQRAMHPL